MRDLKEKEFQGEARKSVKIGSVPQLTGHGLEEGEKEGKVPPGVEIPCGDKQGKDKWADRG